MKPAVLRADARCLPLPDASVDLIVTSPPYFGLRSYTDGGEHYDGQIGSEATPAEWLAAMVECTREWVRVLKPSGSIFVNLGDKYAAGHGGSSTEGNGVTIRKRSSFAANPRQRPDLPDPPASWSTRDMTGRNVVPGFAPKSLMGLPWRYAIACTDQLGLILRRDIIWSKPNGLPESVTDRCRSSHEYVFHLVKQPRYYAAVDEIREPHTGGSHVARLDKGMSPRNARIAAAGEHGVRSSNTDPSLFNPLGKLPGSVWDIPSQPLTVPAHLGVDHFAAFPMELPRRIILGWSPPGVCCECGEGRRPVRGVDWSRVPHQVVEKRALTADETVRWCSDFADWCDRASVSRRALDDAAGTSDMGGWWASRLPHRAAVPTPDQWAKLRAVFDPPAHLDRIVNLTRLVPVAEWETPDTAVAGRHKTRKAASLSAGDYATITGYACACPEPTAPTRPSVVVDPFGGTGTTALVAAMHGRIGISVDRSADYCRLAAWRTTDPAQRAAALQVPKPPPISEGQVALFPP